MNSVASNPEQSSVLSRMAVVSMGLGILSNLIIPIIGSIPAICLGLVSMKRIHQSGGRIYGRGASIVGIVFGSSGILVGIMLLKMFAFPASSGKQVAANHAKQSAQVQILLTACQNYARDHDGMYPPSLKSLTPRYIADENNFQWISNSGEKLPFSYFPGATTRSAQDRPLIAAPHAEGSKRVVGQVDGNVKVISEVSFRIPQ